MPCVSRSVHAVTSAVIAHVNKIEQYSRRALLVQIEMHVGPGTATGDNRRWSSNAWAVFEANVVGVREQPNKQIFAIATDSSRNRGCNTYSISKRAAAGVVSPRDLYHGYFNKTPAQTTIK